MNLFCGRKADPVALRTASSRAVDSSISVEAESLMPAAGRRSVVDVALQGTAPAEQVAVSRAKTLDRFRTVDGTFRQLTRAAAISVLVILGGVILSLIIGAWPAIKTYGFGFLTTEQWDPVADKYGALAPVFGTIVTSLIAMLIAVPLGLLITLFLTELCPLWARRPIAIAVELLAGIPSIIYGIWGLFVLAPFLQAWVQPYLIDGLGWIPVVGNLFEGPPFGIGVLTAGLILAIMVLPFITSVSRDVFEAVPPVLKEAAYGLGCTTTEVVRHVVPALHARRRDRRRDARARRDHGGHLRDRQRAQGLGLAARARHHHIGDHRQRVHRSRGRPLHRRADRARPGPVRDHLHRAGRRALHADANRAPGRMRAGRAP
jgi:phosphate transport system permease protein